MGAIAVAHVITGLGLGGAERMLFKQLSGIDKSRFRSMVISLSDRGGLGDRISDLGVPVHTLNMRPGVPNPLALLKLTRLLRSFKPSLVQTWMPHADLMGTVASKLAGVPKVSWNIRCSNVDYTQYGASTRWSISALARLSSVPTLVIANSNAGRVAHERLGILPKRWQVIPNGFDVDHFRPQEGARERLRVDLGLPSDAFLIAMVARYDVMKDHATALAALRLMPEAHLVCVGKQVTPENPALAAPDLRGRLHLLGQRDDVADVVRGCDIGTLTSAFGEGFPNALGEAMACGLPCVATDVGDSAFIVADTGLVAPPKNPQALAAAWRQLYDMGHVARSSQGARARARVVEHWSLPAVVRAYEEAYAGVVQGAGT